MMLGVLLSATRRAGPNGTELRIVVDDPHVRRIFELTLLDRVMKLYPSVEAALAGERPQATEVTASPTVPNTGMNRSSVATSSTRARVGTARRARARRRLRTRVGPGRARSADESMNVHRRARRRRGRRSERSSSASKAATSRGRGRRDVDDGDTSDSVVSDRSCAACSGVDTFAPWRVAPRPAERVRRHARFAA